MLVSYKALKSDLTHHFLRNACTKSGSLRFSQFFGCWLILSVYIIMSFNFPFVRLFGVRFEVYNYFIWSMIQRGSDTSFTNLWSLLLYIQSLLHYIENAQENKKNTILSYNIAENSKRVKRNEEKVCVCVCVWMLDDVWLIH